MRGADERGQSGFCVPVSFEGVCCALRGVGRVWYASEQRSRHSPCLYFEHTLSKRDRALHVHVSLALITIYMKGSQ